MTLRTIFEDQAFRYLVVAGVGIAAATLVATYVDTGQVDFFGAVVQVVFVAVVGALLVTYWNYMERRAETE
ncbi:hypothetical protein GJR96_06585 [Haloferax sp. MBLA0076]|uniref:Uncharacterized protein n=1 Tax=Haloferax litoreum TaxID=2666140 RepID=A0A6A8GFQ8_9EURY|nr:MULTISPECIES: hypothetical protein [Haloferax]KAB1193126.1 hypothetical protein Hfx1148_06575 [Haloferax sp. CBA1148]MRX21621.1 hypothetical protein [Haloferax litoreum]